MGLILGDFRTLEADSSFMLDWSRPRTMNAPFFGKVESRLTFPHARVSDLFWLWLEGENLEGILGLADVDMKNSHAQIMFSFSGESKSMDKAITGAISHAFGKIGLLKVHCLVTEGNPAIDVLTNFGFKTEAIMRKHCNVDGHFTDVRWLGLLRSESGSDSD